SASQPRLPRIMEATVDPHSRGPDWMPITPKTGSLFHAETHPWHFASDHLRFLLLPLCRVIFAESIRKIFITYNYAIFPSIDIKLGFIVTPFTGFDNIWFWWFDIPRGALQGSNIACGA